MLRQTRKFLPTIPEIRELAAEIVGGHLPDGDEAWGEVMDQIRAVGSSASPSFSHDAIAKVVHAMGWRELCASDNQVADRAHFLRLYGSARQRLDRERQVSADVRELAAALGRRYELERVKAAELERPA
jgi:hypothetical protein